MVGDFESAIQCFEYVVDSEWIGLLPEELRIRRKKWISLLSSGQNPFTPDEISQLRDETSYVRLHY